MRQTTRRNPVVRRGSGQHKAEQPQDMRGVRKHKVIAWIAGSICLPAILLLFFLGIPEKTQAPSQPTASNGPVATPVTSETGKATETPGQTTATTTALPKPTETPIVHPGLLEAAAINNEVVGWIRIAGTAIDYPVVQAQDNKYYLTRDAQKKNNKAGAIFLDYRCDAVSLQRNNILYGHHMKDGSMFASITQYKDKEYLQAHRIIEYFTTDGLVKWEVFSAYVTSTSFYYIQTDFPSEKAYSGFLDLVQAKSLVANDTVLSAEDDILTLSTCTYEFENARFVVHARRVK